MENTSLVLLTDLYVRAKLPEMLVTILAEARVILLVPLTTARGRTRLCSRLHLQKESNEELKSVQHSNQVYY